MNAADRAIADEWAVTVDSVFGLLAVAASGDPAEVGRLRSVARSQMAVSRVLSAHVQRLLSPGVDNGGSGAAVTGSSNVDLVNVAPSSLTLEVR